MDLYIEGEGTDEKDDGYCLTVDLMFEGYGPDKGLAYELSVAVHPHQENGFQFPLNAVPRSLPFPEGKYSTEQKYWAEFLKILTTDDQPSPQPMPARPQPVHPPKLEEVFSPLPDPEPPRKGWWRRLFNR